MSKHLAVGALLCAVVFLAVGCAPSTFVKGQGAGWKSMELNPATINQYDVAWQKTVDTIARDYDIEIMDKDSGYLRTAWTYGISGGSFNRYRGRLTVKYPDVKDPRKIDIKTDAQWLDRNGYWVPGWDSVFNRDVFTALSGRLGRTVSSE